VFARGLFNIDRVAVKLIPRTRAMPTTPRRALARFGRRAGRRERRIREDRVALPPRVNASPFNQRSEVAPSARISPGDAIYERERPPPPPLRRLLISRRCVSSVSAAAAAEESQFAEERRYRNLRN